MKHLNSDSFREKVFDFQTEENWNFKGEKPCVIKFTAAWCQPCKVLQPVLESLKSDEYDIYGIDIDEEYELASFFQIRSIPTLIFCGMKGEPLITSGSLSKSKIETIIKEIFKLEVV
jgi:thioredoxin-like negative regulator of GroEL